MAGIAEIDELLRRGGVSVSGLRQSLLRLKEEAGAQLTFSEIAKGNGRLTPTEVYRMLNILLEVCQEQWKDQIYALVSHTVFDLIFSPRLYDKAVQERIYGSQESRLLKIYDAFVRYRYTNAWGVRIWNTQEFAEKLLQSHGSPLTAEERLKVLPVFLHSTHPNVASLPGSIISRRTKILLMSRFDRMQDESPHEDRHLLTWFVDPKRTFMLQTRSQDGNSLGGTLILGYDEVQKQVHDAYWENYRFLANFDMVLDTPSMNLIDSGETGKTVYETNKQVIIEALDRVREEHRQLAAAGELRTEHQGLIERVVDPVQETVEQDVPFAPDHSFLVPSPEGVEDMEIVELETELKRIAEAIGLDPTMTFQRVASSQSWHGWRAVRDLSSYFDTAPHKSLRHLLYSPENRPAWHDFPVEWQSGARALGYEEPSFSQNATTAEQCRGWLDSLSFEGIGSRQIPLPLLLQTTTVFDGEEGTAFPHYALSRILDKLSRALHHRGSAGDVVFSDALPPDERNVLWFNVVRFGSCVLRFFRRHPEIHRSIVPRFVSCSPADHTESEIDGILVFEIYERTYRHGEKPRAYSHLIEDPSRADNEATVRLQFKPEAISRSASFQEWLRELATVGASWLVYAGNQGRTVERKAQLYIHGFEGVQESLKPDDTELQSLTARRADRFLANFTVCFPYKLEAHKSAERGITKWCRLGDLESYDVIQQSHEIYVGKYRSDFAMPTSKAFPAGREPNTYNVSSADGVRENPQVLVFCSRLTTAVTSALQSWLHRVGYSVDFVYGDEHKSDLVTAFGKADLVLLHRGEESFSSALDAVPLTSTVLVFSGGGITDADARRVQESLQKHRLSGMSCPFPLEPSDASESGLPGLNWEVALARWTEMSRGSGLPGARFPISVLCERPVGSNDSSFQLSHRDRVSMLSQIHTATGNVRSTLRRLKSYEDNDPANMEHLEKLIGSMERSVDVLVGLESSFRSLNKEDPSRRDD